MLSKQITNLRKNVGMSQSQLAARLNVSPSAIGMYEQGRRVPDLITIIALAEIFEVSLDYLITGSESVYSERPSSMQHNLNCPCSTCYWAKN